MANASAAIQVIPKVNTDINAEEETCRIVDKVIGYIKESGLTCSVGPFETTVEGDYDQLIDIIRECQKIAVNAGSPSVSAYVKIVYKPEGGVMTIEQKIAKHH